MNFTNQMLVNVLLYLVCLSWSVFSLPMNGEVEIYGMESITSDASLPENGDIDQMDSNSLLQHYLAANPLVEDECLNAANLYRYCLTSLPKLRRELGYANIDACFTEIDEMKPVDLPGSRLQTLYFLMSEQASIRVRTLPVVERLIRETLSMWSMQQKNALLYFASLKPNYMYTIFKAVCGLSDISMSTHPFACSLVSLVASTKKDKLSVKTILQAIKSSKDYPQAEKISNTWAKIWKSSSPLPASKLLTILREGGYIHFLHFLKPIVTFKDDQERDSFLPTLISYGFDVNFYFGINFVLDMTFNPNSSDKSSKWLIALLENGLDPNYFHSNSDLPYIFRAVRSRRYSAVQLLLTCGANPNLRVAKVKVGPLDFHNMTPLMLSNSTSVSRMLIDKGADVNAQDDRGCTPLLWANKWGVAKLLIDHGADIHHTSKEGINLLMAYLNRPALFQRLLGWDKDHRISVNGVDIAGRSALHFAFGSCRDQLCVNSIRRLLDAGAEINLQDNYGRSPLMLLRIDVDIHRKTLLRAGFMPDLQDEDGNTALHYAAQLGLLRVICVLRILNARNTIRNHNGETPLDIAIRDKMDSVTNLLNELYTDVSVLPVFPVVISSMQALANPFEGPDIPFSVTSSDAKKADPVLKRTVQDMLRAHFKGDPNLALAESCANPEKLIDQNRMMAVLVELGADPDFVDAKGDSVLYHILLKGGAQSLLEFGASKIIHEFKSLPDFQDPNGKTALMIAAKHGFVGTVSKLLASGANPNAKDNNGYTALMEAVAKDHEEAVVFLLLAGARLEEKNKFGFNALQIARSGRGVKSEAQMRIIRRLEEGGSPSPSIHGNQ